ncbi:MAG: PTS sugar transporter subunit IIC [Deltaproteobacteria bacterium]|nr:PTS sugar transporter subunit IIC [Deltaproteobacteria bacterium]
MTDLLWHSFLASFVGSGLSLDRKVAFQCMVSRPIIVAPIIGILLGNPSGGLSAGILFELLYIGDLPIGGYLPSHETAITAVSTAVALICAESLGTGGTILPVVAFSALLIIPVGFVFNMGEKVARRYNKKFFHDAEERMMVDYQVILRKNLEGIVTIFVVSFITIFLSTVAGVLIVSSVFPLLPELVVVKLLPMIWIVLLLIGFAATYNTAYSDRARLLFCGAVILAVVFFMVVIHGG